MIYSLQVQSYQENCSLEGRKSNPGRDFKHNKKLQSAIAEAEKLVAMSNEERLALCHYTEKEKERLENTQKSLFLFGLTFVINFYFVH